MSSSMDYAGNPRREDIDKPVAPLKTDRPDVGCPSGIALVPIISLSIIYA
jgi:hypothetical protein